MTFLDRGRRIGERPIPSSENLEAVAAEALIVRILRERDLTRVVSEARFQVAEGQVLDLRSYALPARSIETAEDPEIEEGHLVAGKKKDIARVGIAVKETRGEQLMKRGERQVPHRRRQIETG